MKHKKPSAISDLLPLIFVVAGIGLLIWTTYKTIESMESRSWPSVEGRIVTSEINWSRGSDGQMASALIEYNYVINAIVYKSDRVGVGSSVSSDRVSKGMREVVARYTVGKLVPVYYNPDDHGASVLESGLHSGLLIPLIVGIVFTVLGFFSYRTALRMRRKAEEINYGGGGEGGDKYQGGINKS